MNSLMIRASAGSGKTFQLSNRFLALLAAGALPTELIALTFTRKAAGEFSDRILSRLAEGGMDEASASKLALELADTLAGNAISGMPSLNEGHDLAVPGLERFRELLELLARDLHRISLATLDSFFVRIAKQFPYELGIGSFELLEADELKAEKKQVLTHIFRTVPERQRTAFLGAFRLATHGREHTRLSALLDEFLDTHHQRFLGSPEREKWGDLGFIWPHGCPWPEIGDFYGAAKDVVSLLGTVVVPKKAHATWLKGWEGTAEWFATYQPGDGRNPPATVSRMLGLLDDLRDGYASDMFGRIEHGLGGVLAKAITYLTGGYLRAELEVRSTRTVGLWTILYAYESVYERNVRLRGRLGFSDVTRVLASGGLTAGGRERMESRLDARYHHWLLDEFQDTSRAQWAVLAGLAEEVVMDSEERRSLFVVGDTKQGIYGWRGGEPRLFDDLLGQPGWNRRMSEWSMQTSWRSSPQVLSLVNRICDPAGPGMRDRFPARALQRWHFNAHLTSPGGELLPGYTAVVEAANSDDEEEEGGPLAALRDLLATVEPLKRGLSCAVLVRSNKNAREAADFLRQEFETLAVEVDAEVELALDNPAGLALLDLFRWLAHPGDRMAWGHISHSPLRLALPADEQTCWQECRERITREGIAPLVGWLFGVLREHEILTPFLEQRMEGIAREAHSYDETGDRSPEGWLRRLEGLVQREYSSEGAIQIMTVHKAKGLEFDMVVVMDLAGSSFDDPSRAGILEFRDDEGIIRSLLLPPKKEMLTADRDLRKHYEQWVADQCVERFCNLYVALTRAKHAAYVLIPEAPKNPSSEMRHDLWIRGALGDAGESLEWNSQSWPALDQDGDPVWYDKLRRKAREEPSTGPETKLGEPATKRSQLLPSRHHEESTFSTQAADLGIQVHRAFEKIGWVDEELSPFPTTAAENLVFELLEIPEIRTRFERGGRNVDLYREQPVEAILNGQWLSGSLDRLHVTKDASGQVTHLEIIDFKTDQVETGGELIARHHAQMGAYREALVAAFGPVPIGAFLLSASLKRWIEIPS